MSKKIISPSNAPKPLGPYSQGILINDVLYGSGQVAINPQTNELENQSIEQETTQVLKNIGAILETAGMNYNHVVKTTVLLSDMSLFAKVNEVYGQFFTQNHPTRETFAVKGLPKNANIEISFIAYK